MTFEGTTLLSFDPSEPLTFILIAFAAQPLCVALFLSLIARWR